MVIPKQHDGLNREVQGLETVGERQFDAPPDGRLDVIECDADLRDLVGHAAMLTRA